MKLYKYADNLCWKIVTYQGQRYRKYMKHLKFSLYVLIDLSYRVWERVLDKEWGAWCDRWYCGMHCEKNLHQKRELAIDYRRLKSKNMKMRHRATQLNKNAVCGQFKNAKLKKSKWRSFHLKQNAQKYDMCINRQILNSPHLSDTKRAVCPSRLWIHPWPWGVLWQGADSSWTTTRGELQPGASDYLQG